MGRNRSSLGVGLRATRRSGRGRAWCSPSVCRRVGSTRRARLGVARGHAIRRRDTTSAKHLLGRQHFASVVAPVFGEDAIVVEPSVHVSRPGVVCGKGELNIAIVAIDQPRQVERARLDIECGVIAAGPAIHGLGERGGGGGHQLHQSARSNRAPGAWIEPTLDPDHSVDERRVQGMLLGGRKDDRLNRSDPISLGGGHVRRDHRWR